MIFEQTVGFEHCNRRVVPARSGVRMNGWNRSSSKYSPTMFDLSAGWRSLP
jgi:hypothetical protein